MSVIVDPNGWYSKQSTEELIELWHSNRRPAEAMSVLEHRLGYQRGDHFGKLVADAIIAERGFGPKQQVGFVDDDGPHLTLNQIRDLRNAAVATGEEPVGRLCKIILESGWNYVDIRTKGRADIDEDQVVNFLEDYVAKDSFYADMTPGQQGFFRLIYNAWLPWYKKVVLQEG